jgi:hypothetical protein
MVASAYPSSMDDRANQVRQAYIRLLRSWAWAISLGLAVFGWLLVMPFSKDPISWAGLIVFLLGWLVIYVTVRVVASALGKTFPDEER